MAGVGKDERGRMEGRKAMELEKKKGGETAKDN